MLEKIQTTAANGGMTYDEIHEEGAERKPFAVTSFADLHGDGWEDVCDSIETLHDAVDWNTFWKAITAFVGKHNELIQHQI